MNASVPGSSHQNKPTEVMTMRDWLHLLREFSKTESALIDYERNVLDKVVKYFEDQNVPGLINETTPGELIQIAERLPIEWNYYRALHEAAKTLNAKIHS